MDATVQVCDVDPIVGQPTKRYRIEVGDRVTELDLCADHAEPIEVLIERVLARQAPAVKVTQLNSSPAPATKTTRKAAPARASTRSATLQPAPTPRGRAKRTVTTLEEIERSKG